MHLSLTPARRVLAATAMLAVLHACGDSSGWTTDQVGSNGWRVLKDLHGVEFDDSAKMHWKILVDGDLEEGYRVALEGPPSTTGVGTAARSWIEDPVPVRTDGDVADLYQRAHSEPHPRLSGELSARYSRWLDDRRMR